MEKVGNFRLNFTIEKITARWDDFNSKQLAHKKFLQNPFLGCLWSVWEGKIIKSAVEATIEKLF